VREASHPTYRQLTVVDVQGGTAAYSGENTLGLYTMAQAENVVAAGNLLASDKVPQAMVEAFTADPDGDLGDRLLAALIAGDEEGGEEGPVHSCGILIVDRVSWPSTDLRVDWSDEFGNPKPMTT